MFPRNENYKTKVIEMIKKMPAWLLALQNDYAVPVKMIIPVLFVD